MISMLCPQHTGCFGTCCRGREWSLIHRVLLGLLACWWHSRMGVGSIQLVVWRGQVTCRTLRTYTYFLYSLFCFLPRGCAGFLCPYLGDGKYLLLRWEVVNCLGLYPWSPSRVRGMILPVIFGWVLSNPFLFSSPFFFFACCCCFFFLCLFDFFFSLLFFTGFCYPHFGGKKEGCLGCNGCGLWVSSEMS